MTVGGPVAKVFFYFERATLKLTCITIVDTCIEKFGYRQ